MANDYGPIITNMELASDAAQVFLKIREVYGQCKIVQAYIARFGTDSAFSDAFDTLMFSGGFDGTASISQMLYAINQLVQSWEANAEWRAVLGLPPL